MSNIIEFLERMGRDAHLRYVTGLELEAALTRAGIEPNLQAAILDGDHHLLDSLVGATRNICCLVNVPDEEEETEEDEEEGDEEEEEEGGEEKE